MSDLVTFVRARLDEDERLATALPETHRAWRTTGGYPETGVTQIETADGVLLIEDDSSWAVDSLPHIARHDPARVLREVEAKRRLLALHPHHRYAEPLDAASAFEEDHRPAFDEPPLYVGCKTCHFDARFDETYPSWWCDTVRLLAAPFADHPDYQAEWSP